MRHNRANDIARCTSVHTVRILKHSTYARYTDMLSVSFLTALRKGYLAARSVVH